MRQTRADCVRRSRRFGVIAACLAAGSGCGGAADLPRPARAPHQVSATLSPYHLAFPIVSAMLEQRVVDHLGIAEEVGVGSYATARVGQLGARVYVYPWDRFNGVQLGAVVRSNVVVYPSSYAVTEPPSDLAAAAEPLYHDVQLTRANGRSSVFAGGSLGLKGIWSGYAYYTDERVAPGLTGLTIDLAMVAGYLHMIGPSPYGHSPDALMLGDAGMVLLEMRLGWSL